MGNSFNRAQAALSPEHEAELLQAKRLLEHPAMWRA